MIEHIFGTLTFRNALTRLYTFHANSTIDVTQLSSIFQSEGTMNRIIRNNLHFQDFFKSWTQPGYPVVTIKILGNHVKVTQKRFWYSQKTQKREKWLIPMKICRKLFWIKKWRNVLHGRYTYTSIASNEMIGYYRLNFDENGWHEIIQAMDETNSTIPLSSRVRLLDDSMNLARGGHIEYEVAFGVHLYLRHEREYLPWVVTYENWKYLYRMLESHPNVRKLLVDFMKVHIHSAVSHTSEAESLDQKLLRGVLTDLSCMIGTSNCRERVQQEFRSKIEPEACCNAVRYGNRQFFDFAFMESKSQIRSSTRFAWLRCATCTIGPATIRALLERKMNHTEESFTVNQILENNYGTSGAEAIIHYIRQNLRNERNREYIHVLSRFVTTKTLKKDFKKLLRGLVRAQVIHATDVVRLMEIPNVNLKWMTSRVASVENGLKVQLHNLAFKIRRSKESHIGDSIKNLLDHYVIEPFAVAFSSIAIHICIFTVFFLSLVASHTDGSQVFNFDAANFIWFSYLIAFIVMYNISGFLSSRCIDVCAAIGILLIVFVVRQYYVHYSKRRQ